MRHRRPPKIAKPKSVVSSPLKEVQKERALMDALERMQTSIFKGPDTKNVILRGRIVYLRLSPTRYGCFKLTKEEFAAFRKGERLLKIIAKRAMKADIERMAKELGVGRRR